MTRDLDLRLERLGEHDAADLVELGCDLADVDRHADAERCFRRAAALGSAVGEFNLGNSLAAQGRWRAAAVAYERAARRGESDAWRNLGLVREELADPEGALAAYRSGVDAGDLLCWLPIAFSLHDRGAHEEALDAATHAAATGDPLAAGVVACWRWNASLDPALEPQLRAGAEHYPGARIALARLLQVTGRLPEALDVLQRGARQDEPGSWLALGDLYLDDQHDRGSAEVAYRAALAAGDESAAGRLRRLRAQS